MDEHARFQEAIGQFAKVHAEDPKGKAATYHETVASWVDRLDPNGSEPLRLAAHCQHLRRWETPRTSYPEGVTGYKRWRSDLSRKHASEAAAILRDAGYGEDVTKRVGD